MADSQPTIDAALVDRKTEWKALGLDPRLLQAIRRLQWTNPSLVQSQAIPLALKGKDVLAKARTGSGKTASYALPIIQRILTDKEGDSGTVGVRALVLVPTRDLCEQVADVFQKLCYYCPHLVRVIHIAGEVPFETQKHRLAELPDILVTTPGKLVPHLDKKTVDLSKLQMIVIDEADLILSFGYKDDIEKIAQHVPKICQGFMMSATLNDDVEALKKAILHTPAVLKLEEEKRLDDNLQQYIVEISDDDKFLLLYVLLKLKLIRGKTLIFVNSIERCFKLRLFLERFSIKCAVLNSELPQNSRYHTVQQFNKGVFDLLIATDEKHKEANIDDDLSESSDEDAMSKDDTTGEAVESGATEDNSEEDESKDEENDDEENSEEEEESDEEEDDDAKSFSGMDSESDNEEQADKEASKKAKTEKSASKQKKEEKKTKQVKIKKEKKQKSKKSKKAKQMDEEYGVARGMDFQDVAVVVNFDFPRSSKNYVHRVGRTARAGKAGVALSFITEADKPMLERVKLRQSREGRSIQPYNFSMASIEGFRYRVEDVLRSVTRRQIKEARYQELRNELLNSEKLKGYFQEHQADLETLKHTKPLQSARVLTHLKLVPDYLINRKKVATEELPEVNPVPTDEQYAAYFGVKSKKGKRKRDPLQDFRYSRKGFKGAKRMKKSEPLAD